jgi:hypothetical protein
MAIERRPEWGVLVLTSRLKYRIELALKGSLSVTLVKCKSDLDKRVWMQLVDDSAIILGH